MTGYLYDASGNRVAKGSITSMSCDVTTNGFTQMEGYVVGPSGEQLTEVNANNTHTNVYAGGKLIGTYDTAGLHFHIDDPLQGLTTAAAHYFPAQGELVAGA